jgi:hypothetical protein
MYKPFVINQKLEGRVPMRQKCITLSSPQTINLLTFFVIPQRIVGSGPMAIRKVGYTS